MPDNVITHGCAPLPTGMILYFSPERHKWVLWMGKVDSSELFLLGLSYCPFCGDRLAALSLDGIYHAPSDP